MRGVTSRHRPPCPLSPAADKPSAHALGRNVPGGEAAAFSVALSCAFVRESLHAERFYTARIRTGLAPAAGDRRQGLDHTESGPAPSCLPPLQQRRRTWTLARRML